MGRSEAGEARNGDGEGETVMDCGDRALQRSASTSLLNGSSVETSGPPPTWGRWGPVCHP